MRLYDLDSCKFILFIILFIHSATVNIVCFKNILGFNNDQHVKRLMDLLHEVFRVQSRQYVRIILLCIVILHLLHCRR